MARDVYWYLICLWTWSAILAFLAHSAAGGGIKGEPRVTDKWETPRVVREGDMVKLQCPISATPDPLFEWYKDGERVKATWARYNTKKHNLKIRNVEILDSGAYTCVGVNGFGQANASMHLIVLDQNEPPGDISPPTLIEVWPETPQQKKVGDSLTFTCVAEGLPTPKISWNKDGFVLGRKGVQLSFSSLQPTDSGLYTCIASSPLGTISANFSVNVIEMTSEKELEISEAVNTTVMEGKDTSLQCTVLTSRKPIIQWLKETNSSGGVKISDAKETPLDLRERYFKRVDDAGAAVFMGDGTYLSKLTIVNAKPSDTGVYLCLGTNNLGFSYKEAHLRVISRDVVTVNRNDTKDKSVNWFFLIIPAVVILIVIGAAIMCQLKKALPDKPVGVSPPTPVLKGDDTSALAPLNPDSHGHLPRPPDLVYQEVAGYPGSNMRAAHMNSYKDQYPSPYPDSYPESYPEPAYSDPYSAERGPTRASEHSYARLTHPSHPSHPSLASHPSHTSHASSSPHLPPPYAHTHVVGLPHTHSHTHRQPQYFVHYNL